MDNLSSEAAWKSYYVTNDQVLALIRMWKEASPTHKSKIQGIIIERLSYLIYSRIKGYKTRSFYSDLIQEGRIGLLKAIQDFDMERGLNFFKFSLWHIKNRVRYYVNSQKRFERGMRGYEKELNESIDVPNPYEYYEEIEGKKVLEDVLHKLPELESKVVRMRFGMGGLKRHTLQQIGDIFSVSRQYVQQVESRAISKLKKNRQIKEFYRGTDA
jgi:RNA polymerase sigma factor (sigma-70 family)